MWFPEVVLDTSSWQPHLQEQLAQKKASKELRTQVLEELKASPPAHDQFDVMVWCFWVRSLAQAVQLTAEQAELLRASQSTRRPASSQFTGDLRAVFRSSLVRWIT